MPLTHSIKVRVRYGETDKMGVIYHANFFYYFELARTELLRSLGIAYSKLEKSGIFFTVREANCKYISNASYDDEITVIARVTWVKKASLRFDYDALLNGEKIATGHTILACIDQSKKLMKIPDEIVIKLS